VAAPPEAARHCAMDAANPQIRSRRSSGIGRHSRDHNVSNPLNFERIEIMNRTKHALTFLVVAGALGFHTALGADTNAPAAASSGDRMAAWRQRLEERAKELNLTDEQKDKVRTILRENLGKLRDLRQDTALSQAEKMEKAKAIREEIRAEFKKVLTPEQFKQWQEKEGETLPQIRPSIERLQETIDSLNLSDEQKEKLRPLHEEQMQKLQDLRDDTTLSAQQKLEKLNAMRQEVMPKMKTVLDDDQYKKWEEGLNQWFESMKSRVGSEKK
jgi:Spy/CpxP family protein refolding chaperone